MSGIENQFIIQNTGKFINKLEESFFMPFSLSDHLESIISAMDFGQLFNCGNRLHWLFF